MYTINRKNFGYALSFSGFILPKETQDWLIDVKELLAKEKSTDFGVFVDMRSAKPFPPEAQKGVEVGQKLFKEKGMSRSVVILNNPIVQMQFKRIGKQTGIYEWERYIDASNSAEWEQIALNWIEKGIDPDKN